MVKCAILRKQLPGLDEPPWPGELGRRIYENVSQQAWGLWLDRVRIIINEYRLRPALREHQKIIAQQMEEFFCGEVSALPPDYVPPQEKT